MDTSTSLGQQNQTHARNAEQESCKGTSILHLFFLIFHFVPHNAIWHHMPLMCHQHMLTTSLSSLYIVYLTAFPHASPCRSMLCTLMKGFLILLSLELPLLGAPTFHVYYVFSILNFGTPFTRSMLCPGAQRSPLQYKSLC